MSHTRVLLSTPFQNYIPDCCVWASVSFPLTSLVLWPGGRVLALVGSRQEGAWVLCMPDVPPNRALQVPW